MKSVNNKSRNKLAIVYKSKIIQNRVVNDLKPLRISTNKEDRVKGIHRILLPVKNEQLIINVDQIVYIQSSGNYCFVHLTGDRRHIISTSLKHFISKYALAFIRCHQSYLVNPDFISAITQKKEIRLNGGLLIPIARRKYGDVLAYFDGV